VFTRCHARCLKPCYTDLTWHKIGLSRDWANMTAVISGTITSQITSRSPNSKSTQLNICYKFLSAVNACVAKRSLARKLACKEMHTHRKKSHNSRTISSICHDMPCQIKLYLHEHRHFMSLNWTHVKEERTASSNSSLRGHEVGCVSFLFSCRILVCERKGNGC
jgi:hypothetical protein